MSSHKILEILESVGSIAWINIEKSDCCKVWTLGQFAGNMSRIKCHSVQKQIWLFKHKPARLSINWTNFEFAVGGKSATEINSSNYNSFNM